MTLTITSPFTYISCFKTNNHVQHVKMNVSFNISALFLSLKKALHFAVKPFRCILYLSPIGHICVHSVPTGKLCPRVHIL